MLFVISYSIPYAYSICFILGIAPYDFILDKDSGWIEQEQSRDIVLLCDTHLQRMC